MVKMDIGRVPLASHTLDTPWSVREARVVRLEFAPGVVTPYHLHEMPVVGYVAEGAFIVQIEGQEPVRYEAGQSLLEPGNTRMARFDNASDTKPAVLIATYLTGKDEAPLITFLEK
jgi:quercetin dioxygenase-like cupin family protein